MIDYRAFISQAGAAGGLERWLELLPEQIAQGLDQQRYGDLPRWLAALSQLPDYPVSRVQLDQPRVRIDCTPPLDSAQRQLLSEQLQNLHPWRKGPFELFGVHIDTEWRSDWKWQRLAQHIEPLRGRRVLDVGCGSGYHCWRMRGAGAELVVGIEPSPLFVMQFWAMQRYIQDHAVSVLPVGIEQLPAKLHCFDSCFSMGVLYHRRSPFDHLIELRETLREGGQLILETLIIDGDEGQVLVPQGRYARMGNVWFIPSPATLALWLKKVGFNHIHLVDINQTSVEEQRSTDWMRFHSLAQYLDPKNPQLSIEGYPAPKRAIFTAIAPGPR